MNRKLRKDCLWFCVMLILFWVLYLFCPENHQSLSPPSDHHPGCYFWWRGRYRVRLQGFNGRVRKLPLLLSFNTTERLFSYLYDEANRQKDDHDLTANEFYDFTYNHRFLTEISEFCAFVHCTDFRNKLRVTEILCLGMLTPLRCYWNK